MLDTQTKEIVKSTIPALKQYGEDITKVFYRELFSRYPQVQGMFDMEKQKKSRFCGKHWQNACEIECGTRALSACGRVLACGD